MSSEVKSVVKRNIAANVIGGGWTIVLNLVAIPIQIKILGAEAYGLLGFVASLQSILILFDLGLSTTVIREVASDTSADRRTSCNLIQTSATIYWIVAGLVALGIFVGAGWIAQHFLIVETLLPAYVTASIQIMAIYVLVTWPVNIYVSTLSGLQRLDLGNILRIVNTTAGQIGGILVLLLTRDLQAFIVWLTVTALLNLILHMYFSRRLLPSLSLRPGFSIAAFKRVWRYSFDLNLISTLGIIFTQSDRILIGALLPLRYLGYYNVAYNVTRGLNSIQSF